VLIWIATVTAFTAPLIYLNNKELIDEQIQRAAEFLNAQLEQAKKITGKYAEEAAAQARATAAELQTKVQGMTHKSPVKPATPSTASLNGKDTTPEYPKVPTHEPVSEPALDEPLIA
jgi:hypothetical protein